jgi:hypothetical protein
MQVIELRNYLLRDGATGDFIRYFEEHFLFSQREEGMHVLGQFGVVDQPNRFVWVRGFESMEARCRGLECFYGGAFWQAHRAEANAMMLEHHDVHLLRPLGSVTALTGGLSLEDRAAEPPGALPPDAGLVAVDFYRARPGALECVTGLVTQRWPCSRQVLGHFVAELGPNDYPRLPVTQDADLLVVVSTHADCRQYEEVRAGESPVTAGAIRGFLAGDVATVLLRPTARSLIRYRSGSPEER